MTTRESLHHLIDRLSEEEVEALARIARTSGMNGEVDGADKEAASAIDLRNYPVLASIWDNEDDAIFDEL